MKQTMHKPTTPGQAFNSSEAKVLKLLERIQTTLNRDLDKEITWGHVGNMVSVEKVLQELSDRIHREGEYS